MEKKLRDKFPENQEVTAGPWYPNQALCAACAEWACNSIVAFVDDWWGGLGLSHPSNTGL